MTITKERLKEIAAGKHLPPPDTVIVGMASRLLALEAERNDWQKKFEDERDERLNLKAENGKLRESRRQFSDALARVKGQLAALKARPLAEHILDRVYQKIVAHHEGVAVNDIEGYFGALEYCETIIENEQKALSALLAQAGKEGK